MGNVITLLTKDGFKQYWVLRKTLGGNPIVSPIRHTNINITACYKYCSKVNLRGLLPNEKKRLGISQHIMLTARNISYIRFSMFCSSNVHHLKFISGIQEHNIELVVNLEMRNMSHNSLENFIILYNETVLFNVSCCFLIRRGE